MKKSIVFLIFAILVSGCSPKVYKQNQVYGKGINSGFKFDNMGRDREIIASIQRNNADFLNYRLSWGVNKMEEILLHKRLYNIEEIKKEEARQERVKKIREAEQSQQKNQGLFVDVVKDYKDVK